MITFNETEKKPIESDFVDFEKKFNIKIPLNLKSLLLKFNGGLTDDSEFFNVLLSIKFGEITIESVIEDHQISEQNIPSGYLPFALDWSDNPLTICMKTGPDLHKIVMFYFDTDEEPEIVANSLEELLEVESIDDL